MYSHADQARLTRRMMFSPRAATLFGVNPNSEMRAEIAASATASTIRAQTTSSNCSLSKPFGGACGSRAEIE